MLSETSALKLCLTSLILWVVCVVETVVTAVAAILKLVVLLLWGIGAIVEAPIRGWWSLVGPVLPSREFAQCMAYICFGFLAFVAITTKGSMSPDLRIRLATFGLLIGLLISLWRGFGNQLQPGGQVHDFLYERFPRPNGRPNLYVVRHK